MTQTITAAEYRKGAAKVSEHDLHKSVVQYLGWIFSRSPEVFWTSIDHGAGKMSKASAGMRKARGVKAGFPDILIMHGQEETTGRKTYVLGIELKTAKGTQSPAQRVTEKAFKKIGAEYVVCRSLEDVKAALEQQGLVF